MIGRTIGLLALVLAAPTLTLAQSGGSAQGSAPAAPGGRGAAPGPASYPPYTRPVTSYVPPRTPDGQPDISGLYVGIPLPRNIETPLAPATTRNANRAGGEFMFGLNERAKLPEGAIV